MKKKKLKKNYLKIIKQIENIRKKNNVNWMNILRVAYKHAPMETAKIISGIYKKDENISKLTNLLCK